MITLRDYQEEAVGIGVDYINSTDKNKRRSLIVAPTAAGKSLFIGGIASRITEPALVLQPSVELLKQNYGKLVEFGGEASIFSASAGVKEIGHITYATLGSIKNNVEEFKKKKVKTVIIDECFDYSTFVSTSEGAKRIGTLDMLFRLGKRLPLVKSYNEDSDQFEYKKILNTFKRELKGLYTVYLNNGARKLKVTLNHPFLTTRGWVEVKDLIKGDLILTSCSQESYGRFLLPTEQQSQIIFASQIGDGNLQAQPSGVSARIRLTQGESQLDYLKWKTSLLWGGEIKCVPNSGYSLTTMYTYSSRQFITTKSRVKMVQSLGLLGLSILWMDDGSMSKLENSATIYTLCHEPELLEVLREVILDLTGAEGILSSSLKNKKEVYYLRFRKVDLFKFTNSIKEFIPTSMQFKLPKSLRGHFIELEENSNPYKVSVFDKYEFLKEGDAFDIEVEDNHNFIVCSQTNLEGEIVHNCHSSYSPKKGSMFRNFMDKLKPTSVLGLTATPFRLNVHGGMEYNWSQLDMLNKNRMSYFKDILHVVQIQEMVNRNYWSKLIYELYDFDENTLSLNSTGAEFTEHSITQAIADQGINNSIYARLKQILKEGSRKNILVFCDSIATCEKMVTLFPGSAMVAGKTPKKERAFIVEEFVKGGISIVFNYSALGIGFDHPELDCIIMGRPTNSLALWYQIGGRGTRVHPLKADCLIIDLCNNVKRFGQFEDLVFENIEGYGWGLFNGDYLLTNTPMGEKVTRDQIMSDVKVEIDNSKDITLDFGKHTGVKVSELPMGYVKWAIKNLTFTSKKQKQLLAQLSARRP